MVDNNMARPQVGDFDDVLEGRVASSTSTYLGTEAAEDLASRAGAVGWKLIHLDGAAMSSKADYLVTWSVAGDFPDTFGHNWDALADAITDLSWLHAEGYVILAERVPDTEWARVGAEIMAEACDSWAANGTPFVVLRREVVV